MTPRWRRGLIRLWAVASALWIGVHAWLLWAGCWTWDYARMCKAPDGVIRPLTGHDWAWLTAQWLAGPAAVLVLGLLAGWVMAGFHPKSR